MAVMTATKSVFLQCSEFIVKKTKKNKTTVPLSTVNKIIIQYKPHQNLMFYQLHQTEAFTTVEQYVIRAGSRKCFLFAVALPAASSEYANSYH